MSDRIVLKQFAKDAKNNGVFGSLKSGSPEIAKTLNDIQKLPAYSLGWEYAVSDTELLPALEELQGIHALFAAALKQLNSWGIVPYDKEEEYYKNALSFDASSQNYSLYRNKTGKNAGINPKDDPENWEKVNLEFEEVKNKANKNLDNVENNISEKFKDMSVSWGIPDYSASVLVTLPELERGYTAPSNGVFYGRLNPSGTYTSGLYIDDRMIYGEYHYIFSFIIPLGKGTIITGREIEVDASCKTYFAPFVGSV